MTTSVVKSQKIAFRKQFKKVLLDIPIPTIESESRVVAERLFTERRYQEAKSVSIFLNMPSGEIDTSFILADIFQTGKRCFVPYCTSNSMEMLQLKDMNDYKSLERNSWGIPEPKLEDGRLNALQEGLDLILMPGLAFDKHGNRIGYGKGYYDRFLEKMYSVAEETGRNRPFTIAIGLKKQLVDCVPIESTDMKPDIIII